MPQDELLHHETFEHNREDDHPLTEGAEPSHSEMEPSNDISSLSNTGMTYVPMLENNPANYISVKNLVHIRERDNMTDLEGNFKSEAQRDRNSPGIKYLKNFDSEVKILSLNSAKSKFE